MFTFSFNSENPTVCSDDGCCRCGEEEVEEDEVKKATSSPLEEQMDSKIWISSIIP